MFKLLLILHQLPQCLVGFFLSRGCYTKTINGIKVYFRKSLMRSGISLGNYIILDSIYDGWNCVRTSVAHEHGHQKQSLYLGWLYLPLVGLPSAVRNIIDRVFHKNWDSDKRQKWYYSHYPENWADKLGGVHREGV